MNGPQVVCAGCGAPTAVDKPVCAKCNAVMLSADSVCPLCNSSLYRDAKIKPADKFGIHYTMTGGYAGKCSAGSISEGPLRGEP